MNAVKTPLPQTCTTRCNRTGLYLWGGVAVLVLLMILLSAVTQPPAISDPDATPPAASTVEGAGQ